MQFWYFLINSRTTNLFELLIAGLVICKNKLEEAYNLIPGMYKFSTLENFIRKIESEEILKF